MICFLFKTSLVPLPSSRCYTNYHGRSLFQDTCWKDDLTIDNTTLLYVERSGPWIFFFSGAHLMTPVDDQNQQQVLKYYNDITRKYQTSGPEKWSPARAILQANGLNSVVTGRRRQMGRGRLSACGVDGSWLPNIFYYCRRIFFSRWYQDIFKYWQNCQLEKCKKNHDFLW